jgi:hypothetical protein
VGQVRMDDQNFQNLIAGCPVVEEIKFEYCTGLTSIHVSGLPKLMLIELASNSELENVEIEASNLKSLIANFVSPSPTILLSCENLKNLALKSDTVTDKWLHDLLSKSPLIESLDLKCCRMLKTIKISSDRIQNLTFNHCLELVEVNIDTPKLHRLKYFGDRISFSSNTSTFSEVSLYFLRKASMDIKKIEFLANFNHWKLLTWIDLEVQVFLVSLNYLIFFIFFFHNLCYFVY